MTRQDYLTSAAECVCKSREEQYGSPEGFYPVDEMDDDLLPF